MKPITRSKLARIDRELATLAARQARLLTERAEVLDQADAPRAPEPEIAHVSSLAQAKAKLALRGLRTRSRVRA